MNQNLQANLQNMFGATHVPGFGYVQQSGGLSGNGGQLGDDASVMMISGLGAADDQRQIAVNPQTGVVQSITGAGLSVQAALTQPVEILNIKLPLWVWLVLAGGTLGAAVWFFMTKKK